MRLYVESENVAYFSALVVPSSPGYQAVTDKTLCSYAERPYDPLKLRVSTVSKATVISTDCPTVNGCTSGTVITESKPERTGCVSAPLTVTLKMSVCSPSAGVF